MAVTKKSVGAVVLLILALVLTTCSTNNPPPGVSSEFWDVDEAPGADAEAGDILALEQRDDAPQGSKGWNMIYVSEIESGTKKYVSGEIYVPEDSSTTPRDIVLWNHPTTGLADYCAPSRREVNDVRIPELQQLLDDGHIVVASDYPGQGLPGPAYYMVGQANARASLDALRTLEHLPEIEHSGKFVQYGSSQGGQTAMHVEAIAPNYAPDFALLGSAMMSPAVRVKDLTTNAMRYPELTGFALSMLSGVKTAHPDLSYSEFLSEESQEALSQVNASCWGIWQNGTAIEHPYTDDAMDDDSDWAKAMEDIDDFTPTGSAPFIIHHSATDGVAPVEQARREVEALCQAGSAVEYREYENMEHGDVIPEAATTFPDWAQDRFEGKPAVDDCT